MRSLVFYSLALLGLCEAAIYGSPQNELASWAPPLGNDTSCSHPRPNTCTFYSNCLEKQEQCGSNGYPIGYGLHYCSLFTKVRSEMSESGQTWITNTMLCLQRDLIPYGTGAKSATCADLKKIAFGTHPRCYVGQGICKLPPSDWVTIVNTISLRVLFGSWDSLKQVLETAGDCAEFYSWLIENEFSSMF
ncbi:hypothetical protein N7474_008193 [Penicillium riverlandense]|uniref:uncharacterized protein n=1 Tax=Penicillium riverlandense TaxID=1903569 RepID=UPI0025477845|nr:uncharacterized protein N7474_008193 [Penicillium riverlandense]KAJ5811892.1 hypothetical protein N7474_008193 [Penicillium riverlandense]